MEKLQKNVKELDEKHDKKEVSIMKDLFELEDDITQIKTNLATLEFLINEFDKYDYSCEVTPRKAIEYGNGTNKAFDTELSFVFCGDHKRIMHLYYMMRDYIYNAQNGIENILQEIEDCIAQQRKEVQHHE